MMPDARARLNDVFVYFGYDDVDDGVCSAGDDPPYQHVKPRGTYGWWRAAMLGRRSVGSYVYTTYKVRGATPPRAR